MLIEFFLGFILILKNNFVYHYCFFFNAAVKNQKNGLDCMVDWEMDLDCMCIFANVELRFIYLF